MIKNKALVITTIQSPTYAVQQIAKRNKDWEIIIIGDKKTPNDWKFPGISYLSVKDQKALNIPFVNQLPYNHYSRKNIGYLLAIKNGAEIIAETDDDNIPYSNFLENTEKRVKGYIVKEDGWINTYKFFTDENIWPRGFPLELLNNNFTLNSEIEVDCNIQQFLADKDPDVDAIYRLVINKEVKFDNNKSIILSENQFCPFNSQNTVWFKEAFPLLYLPSFVSFRMTDIWRSFVAQICLYKAGGNIAFCKPTVYQNRNEHNLLKDFEDEVEGYLKNKEIIDELSNLELNNGQTNISANMLKCYRKLYELDIVPNDELILVESWIKMINAII